MEDVHEKVEVVLCGHQHVLLFFVLDGAALQQKGGRMYIRRVRKLTCSTVLRNQASLATHRYFFSAHVLRKDSCSKT